MDTPLSHPHGAVSDRETNGIVVMYSILFASEVLGENMPHALDDRHVDTVTIVIVK